MWFPLRPRAERVLRVLSAALLLLCRLLCVKHFHGKSSPALSKAFCFESTEQAFRLDKFSKNKVLMIGKFLLSDAFCPP